MFVNMADKSYRFLLFANWSSSSISALWEIGAKVDSAELDLWALDFVNDSDTIQKSFEPYYRTTILSEETDPNKLHDLKAALASYQVYSWEQVDQFVLLFLGNATREKLDVILDACVEVYIRDLSSDNQVDFKSKAKAYVRLYTFLASVLPYNNPAWEKLSTFLMFLIPKLPAPKEDDLSRGIIEAVDMECYRVEVQSAIQIALADQDKEIGPVPAATDTKVREHELDLLSNIIKTFNEQFGNIDWEDDDKTRKVITEEIPTKVAADKSYQNAMKNSDKQNARIEHDLALA